MSQPIDYSSAKASTNNDYDSPPPHSDFNQATNPAIMNNNTVTTQPIRNPKMSYAKTYDTRPLGGYQSFMESLGSCLGILGMVPCLCCSNPYTNVEQGTVGLVTKFGELTRVVDPGSSYVNILSEHIHRVSMMTEVQDIPEQACLTKDNVIVYLKSVIYYNIVDPERAVFGISNIHDAVSERTQTTLRDVIGSRILQDVIERREEIAEAIQHIITDTASAWGVKVESILIKDLRLDRDVTEALSQATQAKRIGESKIIIARAEAEASKLFREAADTLASPAALQIRYLDAMQNMAKQANSKVIFMPGSGDINYSSAPNNTLSATIEDAEGHDLMATTNPDISRQVGLQESLK